LFSLLFVLSFFGSFFSDIFEKKILNVSIGLKINPKERMTHEEFYEYVHSKEFMQPGAIYKQNIYGNIYKEIQNVKNTEEYKNIKIEVIDNENNIPSEIEKKKMEKIAKIAGIFDIAFKYKKEKEKNIKKIKYSNIIYYNEDTTTHPQNLAKEIDMFEKETTGTFFL